MHLTYHKSEGHASRVSTAKAGEIGAPEIEITDEMIAAGVEAAALWDSGDAPEWKVSDIYKEMELARRRAKEGPIPAEGIAADAKKHRTFPR